jgi:hypothetical protein
MFKFERYEPNRREAWNSIVRDCDVPFFQFDRSYMEYHADRFADGSLLCLVDGVVAAVLPANIKDDTCYSHQGLTFGGLLRVPGILKASDVVRLIEDLATWLAENGTKRLIYKAMPLIYHTVPSQEDLYALARLGAKPVRVELSTAIDYRTLRPFSSRRRRGMRKALNAGLSYQESGDWLGFWSILIDRLKDRHGVNPVHSVEEIEMLASRFPGNIRLFTASQAERPLAGVVMYETPHVAHCQYISSSGEGLELGALDGLFQDLIERYALTKRYFDFGISTEQAGQLLNEGLVRQKEEFGGSGIVHSTYELQL